MIFLSSSRLILREYFKLGHDHFTPHPRNSLVTNYPTARRNANLATDSSVKQAVNTKVKLSLWQAVEAHRAVKRRGSHIF
jgi:hypothetical protein